MSVRRATPADAAALARLHAASFPQGWSVDEIAGMCAAQGALTLVADDEGGMLMARVVAGEAEILTIAVDPSLRRSGRGRALLAAAVTEAEAAGADAMILEVAEDNLAARALYAAEGFAAVGRRRGYYAAADGGRIDAFILRRALNKSATTG